MTGANSETAVRVRRRPRASGAVELALPSIRAALEPVDLAALPVGLVAVEVHGQLGIVLSPAFAPEPATPLVALWLDLEPPPAGRLEGGLARAWTTWGQVERIAALATPAPRGRP